MKRPARPSRPRAPKPARRAEASATPPETPEAPDLESMFRAQIPPTTPKMLHSMLACVLDIHVPSRPLVTGSSAPFEYLVHAFFEGTVPASDPGLHARLARDVEGPSDAVVWAARGAGKTFLGAVATTLDLVFKKGIEVRILGGSLEQSQRMYEHLRRLFAHPALAPMLAELTASRLVLKNSSRAQILAQSQTSVRGTRVQKLRCDEVELFDPEVWHAAQLTTRSMECRGPWGPRIRGSVEVLSTMHVPHGLMWNLVADAGSDSERDRVPKRAVFRWGIVDVLARCGPEHACDSCDLSTECEGRAKKPRAGKRGSHGHLRVEDAVRMKSRVSLSVWQSEMLCLRPRRSHCVYPEFDIGVHVGDWTLYADAPTPPPDHGGHTLAFDAAPRPPSSRRWVVGMDFGIRSPSVALLAWFRADDPGRVLHVEAEHVQGDWTVAQHARAILEGTPQGWPSPPPSIDWVGVDPAGHQRSDQTGHSSIAALRKCGLPVRSRRLPLHEGLELVRARLRPAAGASGGASPRLFIHQRCRVLIESLSKYHFPEDKPHSLDPVKDGSDHAADALRYLLATLDKPHEARVTRY